jgi:hypothetical protein
VGKLVQHVEPTAAERAVIDGTITTMQDEIARVEATVLSAFTAAFKHDRSLLRVGRMLEGPLASPQGHLQVIAGFCPYLA